MYCVLQLTKMISLPLLSKYSMSLYGTFIIFLRFLNSKNLFSFPEILIANFMSFSISKHQLVFGENVMVAHQRVAYHNYFWKKYKRFELYNHPFHL